MSKRILYVTQEMEPYTTLTEISTVLNKLAPKAKDEGLDIRILMPKYGTINERRHKLHEVVRLSGMNIIVDDDDFPLIIKVATLPNVRLQVYFLDNEEFFKRKFIFEDEDGQPFDDNAERMIFFCKGVLETLKKFGWAPDIIHCHGWITSLIPFYLRKVYNNEPIFEDSKVIYTVYNYDADDTFKEKFIEKANINDLDTEDLENYREDGELVLNKGAIKYSDAIVVGSEDMTDFVSKNANDLPVLEFQSLEELEKANLAFYEELIPEEEEENS